MNVKTKKSSPAMTGIPQDVSNSSFLDSYLKESNIKSFTPVQHLVWKPFQNNKNLSVCAQTGSGKTLAYLMPLFNILKNYEFEHGQNEVKGSPRAIILAPTRELARQIFNVAKELAHHAKLKVRLLAGGESPEKTRAIIGSPCDILIAAPGRLREHVVKKSINLDELQFLILDEADQLLDMGFTKDLEQLSIRLDYFKVKVALFSATTPPNYNEFRTKLFSSVAFEDVSTLDAFQMVQTVSTFNIYLSEGEKHNMIDLFLRKEAKGKGIVFVNKKETAELLIKYLNEQKHKAKFFLLHGELPIHERKQTFEHFKAEQGGILIATDIAARGIDIKNLAWVLNFDLPFEAVYYVHRAGRVGRAGGIGKVFNFVKASDFPIVERINQAITEQTSIKLNSIILKKPVQNTTKEKVEKAHFELKKKIKKSPIRSLMKKKSPPKKADSKKIIQAIPLKKKVIKKVPTKLTAKEGRAASKATTKR